ncbi:MAG: aminotransferase class V-fold PLP-dependent enzyme [Novosphingobium sp.]
MDNPLYLDHAASAPLHPAALDALVEGHAIWANPSSPHAPGRAVRAALEDARERVKAALGWDGELIFTSGATEALAIALGRCRLPLVAVSAVEHEAVLRLAGEAAVLPVDRAGRIDSEAAALAGLVTIQQVNSETGVIQPLGEIVTAVRAAGGLLLADCAQGAGKLDLPPADLIAIAAHKFGGPIGIGALLLRDWSLLSPSGGQEHGYRPGTEAMPLARAMAAALEAGHGWLDEAARLRAQLEHGIVAAGGSVIAAEADRIATIGAYVMPGMSSAAQLIRFDGMGIAVSAGSACSSGSMKPSHVVAAMGIDGGGEMIRVSIGRDTTQDHIERFLGAWREVAGSRRAA